MKEVQYESALNTFDDISGRYTSLHRGLKMMSEDRQAAGGSKLASMDLSATEVSSTGLTTYEVEADKLKDCTARPSSLRRRDADEVSQDDPDLRGGERDQPARRGARRVTADLRGAGGRSARGRQDPGRLQPGASADDPNRGRDRHVGELLTLQDFWLNEELEGAKQTELLELRVQRDELLQQVSAVQTESEISPIKSYEESVSRVQRQARELEELLIELQEDHRKLKQVPMETVPAGQQGIVREQIEDLEVEMDSSSGASKLQSDKKRQELMPSFGTASRAEAGLKCQAPPPADQPTEERVRSPSTRGIWRFHATSRWDGSASTATPTPSSGCGREFWPKRTRSCSRCL